MTTSVLHHPRVAWDLARTTVAMAVAPEAQYLWFAEELGQLLGPDTRADLWRTRDRLAHDSRPDAVPVELGRWRVRIEDLLGRQSHLAQELNVLRLQANARLAA